MKKAYFEGKLKVNTRSFKKYWETLKQLGVPNKSSSSYHTCIQGKESLTFNHFAISEVFQKLSSNLASNLVK